MVGVLVYVQVVQGLEFRLVTVLDLLWRVHKDFTFKQDNKQQLHVLPVVQIVPYVRLKLVVHNVKLEAISNQELVINVLEIVLLVTLVWNVIQVNQLRVIPVRMVT